MNSATAPPPCRTSVPPFVGLKLQLLKNVEAMGVPRDARSGPFCEKSWKALPLYATLRGSMRVPLSRVSPRCITLLASTDVAM